MLLLKQPTNLLPLSIFAFPVHCGVSWALHAMLYSKPVPPGDAVAGCLLLPLSAASSHLHMGLCQTIGMSDVLVIDLATSLMI